MPSANHSVERLLEQFRDHKRFCHESLKIRNKQGQVVPFDLQPAQAKLHAGIAKQRAQRKPVRIIYGKPRRVMVSAAVSAEIFHEAPFNAGQSALVVAHNLKAARQIWNYHRDFHRLYTAFGGVIALPKAVRKPGMRGAMEYENGSTIEIETARNLDAGRAYNIRLLHLSEYAYYPNARRIGGGLINSVPEDPDTMIIKESTGNGVGNPFHQDCLSAMDPASGSEWLFLFFAWWEHPEYVRRFQTVEEMARFKQSLTREEREIQETFQLSLEQVAWRRWAIVNKCEGSVEMFHQEYPATPEEMFLHSGRPRFVHKNLARMPQIKDAPVGELLRLPGPRRALTFQPLERGPLVIYKRPQANRLYVGGADVAEGKDVGDGTIGGSDPDWSVYNMHDRDTGEQVAKLRARMEPDAFAEYSVALIEWYNWAFTVPESNGPGLAYINSLLRYGLPPALIYHRRPRPDEKFAANTSTAQLLGWLETTVTRVQLIEDLNAAINNLGIIMHDPNTVAEHYSFVVKANGRAEHQANCHDDEVFSEGLVVQGLQHPPVDMRISAVGAIAAATRPGVRQYGQSRQEEQRRGRLVKL